MNLRLVKYFVSALMVSLSLFSGGVKGKSISVSDSVKVSLVTCGAGDELYSLFGHTALWVSDKQSNIDYIFNYGVFDSYSDGFAWKFLRGETDYMLAAYNSSRPFFESYKKEKRRVVVNRLNLTRVESQHLLDLLMTNLKPENRSYRYNYIYDNCATRIGDIVEKGLGSQSVVWRDGVSEESFRDMFHRYAAVDSWTGLGIDILLGADIDIKMMEREKMFIPDSLQQLFYEATVVGSTGIPYSLVTDSEQLVAPAKSKSLNFFFKPTFILLVIVYLFIRVIKREIKERKIVEWSSVTLFSIFGILGLIPLFMVLLSELPATGNNLNLLWLNPLYLLYPLCIKSVKWKRIFALVMGGLIIIFMLIVAFGATPQIISRFIWIVVTLLLSRLVITYFLAKKSILE